MPESRLDAILSATRERIASLRPNARELMRPGAQVGDALPGGAENGFETAFLHACVRSIFG